MNKITYYIIALNALMFGAQQLFYPITWVLGMNFMFLDFNLWYQPLSSMFLHGSLMHLVMNMAVLFQFGTMIETHLGKRFFLISYFVGGVVTAILSLFVLLFIAPDGNMIGASGAISVLFGLFGFYNREYLKGLVLSIALMSFVPLLLGVNVAWYAHIIGFALGLAMGFVHYKRRLANDL